VLDFLLDQADFVAGEVEEAVDSVVQFGFGVGELA
jgi:hypothetical protein